PAAVRRAQRRDRADRVPAGGEEAILERVLRIRHVVRRDIRVARLDRNGRVEHEVLPAVRVVPVEGAGREGLPPPASSHRWPVTVAGLTRYARTPVIFTLCEDVNLTPSSTPGPARLPSPP